MKKLPFIGLLLLFGWTAFAQNDTLNKSGSFGDFIRNRLVVHLGSNISLSNTAPFYNQNPSKQYGWEIGAGYKLYNDDVFNIIMDISRTFYSYQNERHHGNLTHVVRFKAFQNTFSTYTSSRIFSKPDMYLRFGFKGAFWTDSYYIYDIYENGRLVYRQRNHTGSRRWKNAPKFVSPVYIHTGLDCRCNQKLGFYVTSDLMGRYSKINFGLTYML